MLEPIDVVEVATEPYKQNKQAYLVSDSLIVRTAIAESASL
jgi:hypothetical protein